MVEDAIKHEADALARFVDWVEHGNGFIRVRRPSCPMESRFDYDLVVVGAGPAGSVAASTAAAKGLGTLVVERRKKVGIPVQCGEFLPTPKECMDLLPHSPRIAKLCAVPKGLIMNTCSVLRLISPLGGVFEFPMRANVLDRARFDLGLAEEAVRQGADMLLSTIVKHRSAENELLVSDGRTERTLRARVVIGADGPRSVVAQSMGCVYRTETRDMAVSTQYRMTGVDSDEYATEMYFGRKVAPGGYAWIIPKGEGVANVGLGLRRVYAAEGMSARDYLERFIGHHPIASMKLKNARVVDRISALIPVGGPKQRTWCSNAILAGDSAGHVMASNGGGIPTALGAGEMAGISAVDFVKQGVTLSRYERRWKNEMGRELSSAKAVLEVADQLMFSDTLTDTCMRLAGENRLSELIRCRLPLVVDLASKTFVKIMSRIL